MISHRVPQNGSRLTGQTPEQPIIMENLRISLLEEFCNFRDGNFIKCFDWVSPSEPFVGHQPLFRLPAGSVQEAGPELVEAAAKHKSQSQRVSGWSRLYPASGCGSALLCPASDVRTFTIPSRPWQAAGWISRLSRQIETGLTTRMAASLIMQVRFLSFGWWTWEKTFPWR